MKFTGKELFDLGVPQHKIKLVVNKEFSSVEEMWKTLEPKEEKKKERGFLWVDWLWNTFGPNLLPMKTNGNSPEKMSKSELKRLLDSRSIIINGKSFSSTDEVSDDEFPLKSFVWFPNSEKKRTTWL